MQACMPLELLKAATPIWAAMAAALVAVVGWLLKSFVSYIAWCYGRWDQRIALMVALRSEIRTNLEAESVWAAPKTREALLGAFDGPQGIKGGFVPYSATTDAPPLMSKLTDQFHILPQSVSGNVFRYHNLSQSLDAQIKDFRSDVFRTIGRKRQRMVLSSVFDLGEEVCAAGERAIRKLSRTIQAHGAYQWMVPTAATVAICGIGIVILHGAPRWLAPTFKQAAKWVEPCLHPSVPGLLAPTSAKP